MTYTHTVIQDLILQTVMWFSLETLVDKRRTSKMQGTSLGQVLWRRVVRVTIGACLNF